jgi:hypothetical protein
MVLACLVISSATYQSRASIKAPLCPKFRPRLLADSGGKCQTRVEPIRVANLENSKTAVFCLHISYLWVHVCFRVHMKTLYINPDRDGGMEGYR